MPLQVINMPTKLMHGKVKESSAIVKQYMTCTSANFAFKLHPFGLIMLVRRNSLQSHRRDLQLFVLFLPLSFRLFTAHLTIIRSRASVENGLLR